MPQQQFVLLDRDGTLIVERNYLSDPDQVDWFKDSSYSAAFNTKLLLSDGNHQDTAKKLERPVFYLNEKIAFRLQLQAVPSVVAQSGRYMEVRQIDVNKK